MRSPEWMDANREYLLDQVQRIRVYLEVPGRTPLGARPPALPDPPAWPLPDAPPALDALCHAFDLDAFERALLVLCAGVELDGGLGAACAAAQGDPAAKRPTYSLALACLPDAHWQALHPERALRRWLLLEQDPEGGITGAPLSISEAVLHFLLGEPHIDRRLAMRLDSVDLPDAGQVPAGHQRLARLVAGILAHAPRNEPLPLIRLVGGRPAAARAVAALAAAALGLRLYALPAEAWPANPTEQELIGQLWERETMLNPAALMVERSTLPAEAQAAGRDDVTRLLERTFGVMFSAGSGGRALRQRPELTFELERPPAEELREVWRHCLGPLAAEINGRLDQLAGRFDLDPAVIRACGLSVQAQRPSGGESPDPDKKDDAAVRLWDVCRGQARPHMDRLAQRLHSPVTFEDLILPADALQTLREILAQVRQSTKVYEEWGFAARSDRGLGVSALFAGPSGTGKTLAAEVLAREMHLDLYRIDLSQVVSKYIGETEKNLSRVFDAAEEGGAVLLFDEADALFGKRSEVRDSHDRYANIEVGYLLQRMESYRGLAILTTNLRGSLDTAFLRRLRFILQFPFPGVKERKEIWRRMFPPRLPTRNLDFARLAQLNVAGGHIRNIALNAAFLAAEKDGPVGMPELLQAARSEYAKLERSLTAAEIGGWA